MPITADIHLTDGPPLDFWTKLAFLAGTILIVSPLTLRWYDFIDNATTLPFFVIGVIIVALGERNRVRIEEGRFSA